MTRTGRPSSSISRTCMGQSVSSGGGRAEGESARLLQESCATKQACDMACVRAEIPNSKNQIPTKIQKPIFKTQRGSVIDISLLELGIHLDSGSWNLEFAGASGSVRHWLLRKAGLGLGSMNTRLLGIMAVIVVAICIGAMWF